MDNNNNETESDKSTLVLIAKRQRTLLIVFFIYILVVGASSAVTPDLKPLVQLLILPIMVLIIIFTARLSFKLYGKIGASILTLLSIIPLINLIVVLIVNSKASKLIKKNGFRVGLIGASVKEIEKTI